MLGAGKKHAFNYFYILSVVFGAVASIGAVINIIDSSFAMMAIPTMLSTIILAPKVVAAAKDYFERYRAGSFD